MKRRIIPRGAEGVAGGRGHLDKQNGVWTQKCQMNSY